MKVLVAMSGGVDSAVCAYLIKQQYSTKGATLRLHNACDEMQFGENSCCTSQDILDAKSVCDTIGIEHEVYDFGGQFKDIVITDFISSYESGSTPNPCVLCNRRIKFEELIRIAAKTGYNAIATGHYARIEMGENGRYLLKKAIDEAKDQSYVLYSLTQYQLAHTLFPLGEMTKSEARELAEAQGFVNARKHDSQDVCFIPDGDYCSFIERTTNKKYERGNFIDLDGKILGTHNGIIKYTVGQRKGLGIAFGEPMYVIKKDSKNNTVTLGRNSDLFSNTLTVKNINLISIDALEAKMRVKVRIRYNQKEQPATIEPMENGRIRVVFDEPQRAITPGQSAVFYDGDVVVGGGIIE